MTRGALIFMLSAWTVVLGPTLWAFHRLLRAAKGKDKTQEEKEQE